MLVRTQDGYTLIDCYYITISRANDYTTTYEPYAIIGHSRDMLRTIILGRYRTEEDAIYEIDRIELHLNSNANKVYDMLPSD